MKVGKILVLGATGNVGAPLVDELRAKKAAVRAAVRNVPESARTGGVEYVDFDYFDRATYPQAFEGVGTLYLLTPVVPEPVALTMGLLEEAKRAGVRKIVKQSSLGVERAKKVRLLDWHREAEEAVKASGIPSVILRPNGFYQNFLSYADEIAEAGVFHLPMGSDRCSYIDARDVARAAAVTLVEDGHEGRTYELTGPKALSVEDVADILSDATGDQIKYVPISDEVARRRMLEDGAPEWLTDGLVELQRFWRQENSARVLLTVRNLTGKDPLRFEDFAREFKGRFQRREAA